MTTVPWWASDDPWSLSPDDIAAADERQRQREIEKAETPDEPPKWTEK